MTLAVVPGIILFTTRASESPWPLSAPLNYAVFVIGIFSIGLGLILMVRTIALFATVGKGTLAPWAPPKKFVVRGIYRHVRNPMISGVFSILLGECLLFSSIALFAWFLVFVIMNVIYIPLFEEPVLERRFGRKYLLYKGNVSRWIPRLRPWKGDKREDL